MNAHRTKVPEQHRPPAFDPRPPLDRHAEVSDWIHRRHIVTPWELELVERLEMILKKDSEGRLTAEPRRFRQENMGLMILGPPRIGKTELVRHVMWKYLGEDIGSPDQSGAVLYYRVHSEATVKGLSQDISERCGGPANLGRMRRAEAQALAQHRMELAGVRLLIIDEMHNALGRTSEPVALFLKGLLQDSHGLAVIIIGTDKLKKYLELPEHEEAHDRLIELRLEPFEREEGLSVISKALQHYSDALGLTLANDITGDPHFSARILDAYRGSHGRCMRLIATTVVFALENGRSCVGLEDFEEMFRKLPGGAGDNPFEPADYATAAAAAAALAQGDLLQRIFEATAETGRPKRKRKARKAASK